MFHLQVKNFGVLKDIDIQLNTTNLFIGDNGSGKSTLAKLITVLTDFTIDEDEMKKKFQYFNIDFLKDNSFIQLKKDDEIFLEIKHHELYFFNQRKELVEIVNKNIAIKKEFENRLQNAFTEDDFSQLVNQKYRELVTSIKNSIYTLESKYIPAERNLISLFNQSLSNMIRADIPLPRPLLEFSAHYNSARHEIKELDLLNMKYKNENAQDKIYYKDGFSLPLEHSSSGIQAALPLYLTLKYFASKHENIIIEEPELNLYPESQIETVKYMIENRNKSSLYIMTHSPYILSILNLLIFAYKAAHTNSILKEKVAAIIPQEQHINPQHFSAYLIKDGTAINIKGEKTGMIQENVIDTIGEELDETFFELTTLFSEFKDAH